MLGTDKILSRIVEPSDQILDGSKRSRCDRTMYERILSACCDVVDVTRSTLGATLITFLSGEKEASYFRRILMSASLL